MEIETEIREMTEKIDENFKIVRVLPRKDGGYIITFEIGDFKYSRIIFDSIIGNDGKTDGMKILKWIQKEVLFLLHENNDPLKVATEAKKQIDQLISIA